MKDNNKKFLKWIAPILKIIVTITVIIILATVIRQTSPFPYLIVSICSLVPFAYLLAKRLLKLEMPIWVDFCVLIFVIMAADLGSGIGLYKKIGCYDLIVHGFFGLVCSIVMLYFWCRYVGAKPKFFGLICIFLVAMGFAALWECWEFTCDLIFHQSAQLGLEDTMTDILIAAAGAIVFSVAYLIDIKTGEKIFRPQIDGVNHEKDDRNNRERS